MQNKGLKESGQSFMSAPKTSQMKKNPLRKSSPLNWFPRKKVDSFLKRKIKQLQEVGGMNSTLDETLGDSSPHYSRILREKIAVREAAHKAMETRKSAMVEASWCRILQAARIQSKEAEALLFEAEKTAAEAFEAATEIGVIMFDIPDFPRKNYEIETACAKGERSTTTTFHTVTASFESAFEVDKQVAAAVKSAFGKLASCPSINKDEFKELLLKISENPDMGEGNQDLSELSSECESDAGSEFDPGFHRNSFCSQDLKFDCEKTVEAVRERKYKKKQSFEKFNTTQLADMMLERLRFLQEDELASLATIVATCGLNAALVEAENDKQLGLGSASDYASVRALRRISSYGGGGTRKNFEVVNRLTKLKREVLEEKNDGMNDKEIEDMKRNVQNPYKMEAVKLDRSRTHNGVLWHMKQYAPNVPSLDKFPVKLVSKLEREVQEAKSRRSFELTEGVGGNKVIEFKKKITSVVQEHISKESTTLVCCHTEQMGKENIDLMEMVDLELEMPLVLIQQTNLEGTTTISLKDRMDEGKVTANSLGKEKVHELSLVSGNGIHGYQKKYGGTSDGDYESLDRVIVKHVSRLEKEKMTVSTKEEMVRVKRRDPNTLFQTNEGSLDQILVKHKSRLEKEKIAAAQQPDDQIKNFVSRREARERELQEAWVGIGLGNSIHPHISSLEQDKLKRMDPNKISENIEGSLDQILVKHESKLVNEKVAAAQQPDDQIKHFSSRREARERELQEAWGGLSLGNSIHPHVSRLERDKAAWLKAEEDERRKAMEV